MVPIIAIQYVCQMFRTAKLAVCEGPLFDKQ